MQEFEYKTLKEIEQNLKSPKRLFWAFLLQTYGGTVFNFSNSKGTVCAANMLNGS